MQLTACQGCRRHVRVDEACCPFCDCEVASPAAEEARRPRRAGRAAMVLFGAGLTAVALTGCATPVYGGPVDAGPADAGPEDGSTEEEGG